VKGKRKKGGGGRKEEEEEEEEKEDEPPNLQLLDPPLATDEDVLMCTSGMTVCSPINNSKGKEKKTEEQIASIFRRDSKQDTIQRYH